MWGPIKVQKRSLRNLGNDKTMLERAQELKKKANMDIPKGNLRIPAIKTSSLISVAADIGIVGVDGNPSMSCVLDNIVSIDNDRCTAYTKVCKLSSCKDIRCEESGHKEVDTVDTNASIAESLGEQSGVSGTPDKVDGEIMRWMTLAKVGPK